MALPASIGPYRVVRELGRGGMGVVLEVRDPAVPTRRLALKLIQGALDAVAVARFMREARLMARVKHPNVVAIHSQGEAPEGPYLVTDLVEGEPLDERCRRGPLDAREAARIVRDLAGAVAAMHAAGVLHRDLKPHNVIVRPDGSPALLDFGLARDMGEQERLTRTGVMVGTLAYMAPEQAEGLPSTELDERVDVYGLGAILFELLAGRPPFEGATGPAMIKRLLLDDPRWPSATRPSSRPTSRPCCAWPWPRTAPSASRARPSSGPTSTAGSAASAPRRRGGCGRGGPWAAWSRRPRVVSYLAAHSSTVTNMPREPSRM